MARNRSPRPSAPADDDLFEDDFENEDPQPSPRGGSDRQRRLLLELVGKWYWIILGLVLGLLGSLYYLGKAPKLYSATTTLLLRQNISNVLTRGPEMSEALDMRSVEAMNTVAERLRRAELLEKVAARSDIRALPGLVPVEPDFTPMWMRKTDAAAEAEGPTPPPPPPMLAGMIAGWTEVSVRKGTRLMDLTVNHPVPEVAQAVADAIASEYITELVGTRSEGRSSAAELLMRESEQARSKLQTAENALAIYRSALELHKLLEAKEAEVEELARRYRAKHPRMVTGRGQLVSLQTRFLEEFNAARSAPMDREYWQANSEDLVDTKGTNPTATETSESIEAVKSARRLLVARTSVLMSEITSQTTVFNAINIRIQETGINQQSPESEAEISSKARKPSLPSSPVPAKIIAAGCAGGLVLGLAIAFFFVRLDNRFHTVAQVESETELPILAAISAMTPGEVEAAARKFTPKKGSPPVESIPGMEKWSPLLVFRPPLANTRFTEMFRVLRTSVSLLGNERKRQVTLFTSALPGEGKSLISTNFALASAQQGKKTLLIDMDLRKPTLHRVIGVSREGQNATGLTRVLAGQATMEESIIRETGAENLHVLTSGPRAPSPGELLNAIRVRELLDEATAAYDVVVIDSAPLLAVPDTRLLAGLVDNLCLVVRAEYVPKGAVLRAIELLASADHLPSGIVFNGFIERKHLIGQNYSYGQYKTNRYGRAYRYGHGGYGSYGEDDDGK